MSETTCRFCGNIVRAVDSHTPVGCLIAGEPMIGPLGNAADAHDAAIRAEGYQAGRAEVLAQIATIDPWRVWTCQFCGARDLSALQHAADCLWLEAQQTAKVKA